MDSLEEKDVIAAKGRLMMSKDNNRSDKDRIKNITNQVQKGRKFSFGDTVRFKAKNRSSEEYVKELFAKPEVKDEKQLHRESKARIRKMKKKKKRNRLLWILAACLIVAALIPTIVTVGNFNSGSRHDAKGLEAYESGDYDTAVREFKEAVSFNGQEADYYDHLGMAYIEMQSYDEARGYFNQADAFAVTEKQKAIISRDRGIACLYQGRYDEAVKSFDRALEKDISDEKLKADILYYEAEAYKRSGKYEQAIDSYSRIIDIDDDAAVRMQRGLAYQKNGMYAQAETDLYAAIKKSRKSYSVYLALYDALKAQGKDTEAADLIDDVLELSGNSGEDLFIKGMFYSYQGDSEKASESFNEALGKKYSAAYLGIGELSLQSGEYKEAAESYKAFFNQDDALDYDDELIAKAYNQLAVCLIHEKDYEGAEAACQEGLSLGVMDMDAPLSFNRIVALENLGRWEEAYNNAKTYAAKYPDDDKGNREYTFLESRKN